MSTIKIERDQKIQRERKKNMERRKQDKETEDKRNNGGEKIICIFHTMEHFILKSLVLTVIKMEAVRSLKTLVESTYKPTQRYNPQHQYAKLLVF